ncbi:MAG: hypothetical protein AMK69_07355 [Nitrospira bacterium SG8_3]|nr:MAG: hypothetical protein AMK69_07355 [Nitrospira bacterium SG8_3]
MACLWCIFQEAGTTTLADLVEYVNRAISRRPRIIFPKSRSRDQVLTWKIKDLTKNMGSQNEN